MLNATVKIDRIEYEEALHTIFPTLSRKISERESSNMIVRLFRQLGDTAEPIMIDLLQRLPPEIKDALLVQIMNAYEPELTDKLNEKMSGDKWGQFFQIGSVFLAHEDGIILNVE